MVCEPGSARKNLEEQLRQVQKMEAIGRLAGGIAHDFNNLLTVISGYSEIVLSTLSAEDPMRESIQAISDAGVRAASLTRQLLTFSRQRELEPRVLNLNEVVREVERMLRRLIGEDVLLTSVLDPAIHNVKIDPALFEQVLMNLAVNARDAMPTGGKLTIETCNVNWDRDYAATHPQIQTGPYVMLAVTDTGSGMPPEARTRIFEPFFTTKEKGKGTGLGLSTVYGIVKQSGGYVMVQSEEGRGTTFQIYLPRVEGVAEKHTAPVAHAALGGTETVLLVEDEESVRQLVRETLAAKGYRVVEAENGESGMAAAARHDGKIDLVITDVVMPGMGGRELVKQLAQTRPQTKVLYLSGYTEDAILSEGTIESGAAFLQKPFTLQNLSRKVREVLE